MSELTEQCLHVRLVNANSELAGNMVETFTTGDLLIFYPNEEWARRVAYFCDGHDLPDVSFDSLGIPKDLTVWGEMQEEEGEDQELLFIHRYEEGWV